MDVVPLDQETLEASLPLGEHWGYDRGEWARLVRWTDGCARLALDGDQAAGVALGFPYGEVGWIGDVLVLESHRGAGLGSQVTRATVAALQDKGCSTVKLYATPKAIGLYERLGFVGEAEFLIARGTHRRGRDPEVVPLEDRLDAALALDRAVFTGDRSQVVRDQLADHPEFSIAVLDDEGALAGYGQARPGEGLTELGPIVARGGDAGVAQDLVDGLLVRAPEGEVEVTYPRRAWAAETAWSCRGFVIVNTPLEMRLGPVVDQDRSAWVAAGGQELG